MAYRKKLGRKRSRKMFSRKAGSHGKNFRTAAPMRGGIRL